MVQIGSEIKDAARVNLASQYRIQQFSHVGTNRSGTTAHPNIAIECPLGGNLYIVRYTDATNNGTGTRHGKGRLVRFLCTDTLKHRVNPDAIRQPQNGFDRSVTALGKHVCCPEFTRERLTLPMTAQG